ncbi:MAG: YihY/virulence factor BrkB family protein, partial [Ilumatobacteraceae bacterium]
MASTKSTPGTSPRGKDGRGHRQDHELRKLVERVVDGRARKGLFERANRDELVTDVLARVVRNFFRDDGTHMAAGVAYYAFFSLFPLVLGTVAVAGFFISSDEAQARLLDFLAREVPGLGSSEFLRDNISGVVRARGTIGLVSIVALFWSGRAVLGAVHRVVNRAWKLPEPSHFITQQMSQLGVGVAIGLMFLLTTGMSIL